jgi:hypothetical protein
MTILIPRPPQDYGLLYQQIGRLLESPPEFLSYDEVKSPTGQQWLGRAHALISEVSVGLDGQSFDVSLTKSLHSAAWSNAVRQVFGMLYRALAHCELKAPSAARGSFIPVGNSLDAFAALSKLLQSAKSDVLIVDPYLDETVLTEFGLAVPEGVTLRLLADEAAHKPTLAPAVTRWVSQYGGSRPLSARLAVARSLHDRAIFIDRMHAWTVTQSLKDFAKRSPAEIVRADDTAALKIAAYEQIWTASRLVV